MTLAEPMTLIHLSRPGQHHCPQCGRRLLPFLWKEKNREVGFCEQCVRWWTAEQGRLLTPVNESHPPLTAISAERDPPAGTP